MTTENDPRAYYRPIGDNVYIPIRYTATVDEPRLPTIRVTVALVGGRDEADTQPVVEQVQIVRRPDGPPVTSTTLRDIPLARIVRESIVKVGRVAFDTMPEGEGTPEFVAAVEATMLDAYDARQGVPVTNETLRKVAEIYRAAHAAGKPPTQSVARELMVSRSTAGRYVQRARQAGHLRPTRQRVAGA